MSGTLRTSESPTKTELQLLHKTTVDPNQIDQLGHMNVRFYLAHTLAGARELLKRIGLPGPTDSDGPTRTQFTDLYTRHYHEQLEGASLEVWGGVLEVRDAEIRLYFELRNPDRGELAATFAFRGRHEDVKSGGLVDIGDEIALAAERASVDWPKHGQPRSLDLNRTPPAQSLSKLKSMGLGNRPMHVVKESACDAHGVYRVDAFQDLVWASDGINNEEDWLRTLENGDRMAFATMESRFTLHELPRVGARVQSYWATVGIVGKSSRETFWVFDLDREALLATASFADVAFNVTTRRAIEIPDFERVRLEKSFHPELA